MSQLIAMRQRMRAVRTIQKTTRAMCLISMSMHTRMRPQRLLIERYSTILSEWLAKLQSMEHHIQPRHLSDTPKQLLIVIGAQRGLCGALTNSIAHTAQSYCKKNTVSRDMIYVGLSSPDFAIMPRVEHYEEYKPFVLQTIGATAERLTMHILRHKKDYSCAHILSCQSTNFFSQLPLVHQIIPYVDLSASKKSFERDQYIWEQTPQELIDCLTNQALQARIYSLLFQSFMAEQAARFIAMDSATRNADNLLVSMRLNYNKLRQAKITKELTDLIGSFF